MTEQDRNILIELIEKYGFSQIEQVLKLEKRNDKDLKRFFLEYMYTTNINPNNNEAVNSTFYYTRGTTEFSNGVSSVFSIKHDMIGNPIINYQWVIQNLKIMNKPIRLDTDESKINKSKIIKLMNAEDFELSMDELSQLVYEDKMFSVIELKLIKKLLENPKIYMSKKGLAIIAESDKGKAYILGKDKNGQRTF